MIPGLLSVSVLVSFSIVSALLRYDRHQGWNEYHARVRVIFELFILVGKH